MRKHWHKLTPDAATVEKLCLALNCHPLTASILVNRHISTPEDASRFLNISLDHLRPPFDLKDLDRAVQRIIKAITLGENILVFGDYDVDGVTATSMFMEFFRHTQTPAAYYIPHRIQEGYGLQADHISRIVITNRATLIITVDCGSASHDAVTVAKQKNIDVIVVDHHHISSNLPPAVAVVNPKRADCHSGFEDLSGVGVTFYLIIALRKRLRDMGFWKDISEPNLKRFCDLVALGTVADMVPLMDENRILTYVGLEEIRNSHRLGIQALKKASGLKSNAIDAEDIAYKLAPRINSAGRMDHAGIAVQLLTTEDQGIANQIAFRMNTLNSMRQEAENKLMIEILKDIQQHPDIMKQHSLVLCYDHANEGILGIVASKLVQRFYRPVVLASIKDGKAKGSARSIPGFDLYQGLCTCSDELITFGGHAMAAGLTFEGHKVEPFKEILEMTVQKMTSPEDFVPKIPVDYELCLDEISDELINEMQQLRPYGTGNPEPILMTRHVRISSSKIVGNMHRQMVLTSGTGKKAFNAIQFNIDPHIPLKAHYEKVLFKLNWNLWNGEKTAQLTIEDM